MNTRLSVRHVCRSLGSVLAGLLVVASQLGYALDMGAAAIASAATAASQLSAGPAPEHKMTMRSESSDLEEKSKLLSVANGLVLEGNGAYNISGSSVTLTIDRISNSSSTRTSGTLRLQLWASTSRPARGVGFTGFQLASSSTLSPLSPNFFYSGVVRTAAFTPPANGTYWMILVLDEFNPGGCSSSDGYCLTDSLVFSTQQTFGPPPSTGGLALEGTATYNISGSSVTLGIDRISNSSSTRTTGTLRLQLWASTSRPARGASFTGFQLASSSTLSPLSPNFFYSNVVRTATFTPPPNGTYWMIFVLDEFNPGGCSSSDGYCLSDSIIFDRQETFGVISPPPSTTVTVRSRSASQCYENYPQAAYDELARLNPGLYESFSSTTSCASLGMPVYAGVFAAATSVRVYTTDIATAQILCSAGLLSGCTYPPPSGGTRAPSANVPVTVNPQLGCPGYYVGEVGLRNTLDGSASGTWGLEMLLTAGNRLLNGGLNFGGYTSSSPVASGFAAFSTGSSEGSQRINFTLTGDGGLYDVVLSSTVPPSTTRTTVFSQRMTLGTQTISNTLANGFHILTVQSVNGLRVFNVAGATTALNGGPSAFTGGAVVGGYLSQTRTGFAALCTSSSQSLTLTTSGRTAYGAGGAGDMRLTLKDGQTQQLLFDSGP